MLNIREEQIILDLLLELSRHGTGAPRRLAGDSRIYTWYGNAVREDFVPQRKPDNYPGYILNIEKLNNPSKVDRSRLKYALIGVLIVMLFYLVPRLF